MNQASEQASTDSGQGEMGFLQHLQELRTKIFKCLIAIFLGMLACFAFAKQLFDWLMLPLFNALPEDGTMIYTSPVEAFFTYIKVAIVAGIVVTSPYIFYQIWSFAKPGLYAHERKLLIPISFLSALLFVVGGTFGYTIIFPYAYKFLMGFADVYISPKITMREGFSFSLRLLLAFGVVFELPVVIFFLARLGLVTSKLLRKYQKYAILGSFILSALLTPPDLVTQTLMAGPLIVLYELGIWIAKIFGRREKKRQEEPEETAEKPATGKEPVPDSSSSEQ